MIQIIGRKSCFETKKAMRYLSERGRDFQFVDLSQRDLSRGEWDSIFRCVEPDALIDRNSPYYRKRLVYMEYDPAEELMEHPEIIGELEEKKVLSDELTDQIVKAAEAFRDTVWA